MNEISISWASGKTLDRYVISTNATRYNGAALESFNASNWTTYASSLTEQGSTGDYFGSLSINVDSGVYTVTIRERQGGSAAITDPTIGGEVYYFDGSEWTTLLDIAQAIDVIESSGNITVTLSNPVAQSGDITIVQGDDYSDSDDRALEWSTSDSATWPDLTAATIAFVADKSSSNDNEGDANLTKSGSVITATGATKMVRVELAANDTDTLAIGSNGYNFTVTATLSNIHRITLNRGTMTVLRDQT